jgi:hypothetical protein
MPEIYIVTKNVRVNQLPHIFLLVVARDPSVLKLASDLRHLIEDYLFLLISGLAVADVTNVKGEAPHGILLVVRHTYSPIRNYLNYNLNEQPPDILTHDPEGRLLLLRMRFTPSLQWGWHECGLGAPGFH